MQAFIVRDNTGKNEWAILATNEHAAKVAIADAIGRHNTLTVHHMQIGRAYTVQYMKRVMLNTNYMIVKGPDGQPKQVEVPGSFAPKYEGTIEPNDAIWCVDIQAWKVVPPALVGKDAAKLDSFFASKST